MMGERMVMQESLFYAFRLEDHVPADHLVRRIDRFVDLADLKPQRLAGDTAYGSAEMLNWLADEKQIAPHIPVIDKSGRRDGTFAREDPIPAN